MVIMLMIIHVVQQGDTVGKIAQVYGVSAETIIFDNQLPPPYSLTIGQSLLIVGAEETPLEARSPVYIGGYAYPYISTWVLEQTLPYLTYLYIFSYGFDTDGNLIAPALDDSWMISMAGDYGVAPVMTLTPLGPDGNFNNSLITAVVNDYAARENLRNQIMIQMEERGFEGLDIDFEYIPASDREAFVDFVAYMKEGVSALGYPVSVALAPKTSATQTGLLYEGKDYPALGAIADYVLLMTYEWGYTYGPPMAVAPINKVREVVDYAITEIPPDKIHLGIPNYGYDWPLPFVRGTTKAETIGNVQAVQRAIEFGVPIQFSESARSPFYFYENENIQHEVWFEDVRSMDATFELIKEYGLRGAGYWNLMRLFRANWLLLSDRFVIL